MYLKKFSVGGIRPAYLKKPREPVFCDFSHCVAAFSARILRWFSKLPFFQHYLPYPAMLFKNKPAWRFAGRAFYTGLALLV